VNERAEQRWLAGSAAVRLLQCSDARTRRQTCKIWRETRCSLLDPRETLKFLRQRADPRPVRRLQFYVNAPAVIVISAENRPTRPREFHNHVVATP